MKAPLALGLAVALAASGAQAQEKDAAQPAPKAADAPPRTYGNLRIGASSVDENGHPELCGEVAPLAWISVEGCGTGAGMFHHDARKEMSHYRANVRVVSAPLDSGVAWIEPRVGVGFSELQVGEDKPGFHFAGTGDRHVETAGPEISGDVRLLVPMRYGFELLADVTAGAAWFPHAPELLAPMGPVQPFLTFGLGVGF